MARTALFLCACYYIKQPRVYGFAYSITKSDAYWDHRRLITKTIPAIYAWHNLFTSQPQGCACSPCDGGEHATHVPAPTPYASVPRIQLGCVLRRIECIRVICARPNRHTFKVWPFFFSSACEGCYCLVAQPVHLHYTPKPFHGCPCHSPPLACLQNMIFFRSYRCCRESFMRICVVFLDDSCVHD